jgi:hypothetical protein
LSSGRCMFFLTFDSTFLFVVLCFLLKFWSTSSYSSSQQN